MRKHTQRKTKEVIEVKHKKEEAKEERRDKKKLQKGFVVVSQLH